jgi:hypothetical protein
MVLNYILSKLGLIYNESNEIINVRNNLKRTSTLRRTFYVPEKKEILNKLYIIKYRNNPKFKIDDLLRAKNNLKNIKH